MSFRNFEFYLKKNAQVLKDQIFQLYKTLTDELQKPFYHLKLFQVFIFLISLLVKSLLGLVFYANSLFGLLFSGASFLFSFVTYCSFIGMANINQSLFAQ